MKLEFLQFSIFDYVLFVGMLVVSALIGVYFGIYKKQTTTDDYLLGGKNMGVFPVAMSLAASYISAITLLGMPSEMYYYDSQFAMSCIAGLISAIIIGEWFLPVFYDLNITSSFEYLEMRFDRRARMAATLLCFVNFVIYLPVVMYVPALAFNIVSGIAMEYVIPVICLVCIFYTAIGGIKAVIWTDTIQFIAMNGAIVAILMLGVSAEGGFNKIWKVASKAHRINFLDFDLSPYKRMTFLSIMSSMTILYVSVMGVNQLCIQRFLSVPSLRDGKKILAIYILAILVIKLLCLFVGFIILSRYFGCDPYVTGIIAKTDQILPYYVMDTTQNIPGIPGLFIAGVFSAALSSMSSYLNTICGIIYKDFLCLYMTKEISEQRASNIMKLLNVFVGLLCMAAVFWIGTLGSILQMSLSLSGVTTGPMLAIFVMGMFSRRANTKGTVIGAMSSLILLICMMYGNSIAISKGLIENPINVLRTDQCEGNITRTIFFKKPDPEKFAEVFFLFRISTQWYYLIGLLTSFIIGLPISYMTEAPKPHQLQEKFFSPLVRSFVRKSYQNNSTELKHLNELPKT